jgi:hypothetical protein
LQTECSQETFLFAAHFSRRVEAGFTAGHVSTDGGSLLLREVDRKIQMLERLAACFSDVRKSLLVKHRLSEMLARAFLSGTDFFRGLWLTPEARTANSKVIRW